MDLTYLKQYIDRPILQNNRNFEIAVAEISKYLNEFEMDRVVDFMHTLATTTSHNNMTPDDCTRQLRMILGEERLYTIKALWSKDNQHLVKKVDNKIKYLRKSDNTIWCGLDETDNPNDYIEIRM